MRGRRTLVTVASLASLTVTLPVRATPACRFPFERPWPAVTVQQEVPPQAALLEAPTAVPLRATSVDERVAAEISCGEVTCELVSSELAPGRDYVFRAASGQILAFARGPETAFRRMIGGNGIKTATRERLVPGDAAAVTRRAEEADPTGTLFYATAPGTSLAPGGLYLWDEPDRRESHFVAVTKTAEPSPPAAPDLVVTPMVGHGACPPYGAHGLQPRGARPDVAYRWTVLDADGKALPIAPRIGPTPMLYATEDRSTPVQLDRSYIVEVEAIDAIGRASPSARYPITLTKTGGVSNLGMLLPMAIVAVAVGLSTIAPFVAIALVIVVTVVVIRKRRKPAA